MQEEEKEIKKVFYQLIKQRNVREEAGKGKKSYSKVHREAEGRGGLACGDNSVGHWASHGCHRSPDWLSDGFNTAAKPFNTGCLQLCVGVCACVLFVCLNDCYLCRM